MNRPILRDRIETAIWYLIFVLAMALSLNLDPLQKD